MIGEIEVRWPRRDERGAFRCIVSMGGDVTSKEVGLLSGYHEVSPPPGIVDSTTYMGDEGKIFDDKGVIGKIFKTNGLFRRIHNCFSIFAFDSPSCQGVIFLDAARAKTVTAVRQPLYLKPC